MEFGRGSSVAQPHASCGGIQQDPGPPWAGVVVPQALNLNNLAEFFAKCDKWQTASH